MDEFEESRRAERDVQTESNKTLKSVGGIIQNLAVSRQSSAANNSRTSPELEDSDGHSPGKRGTKRQHVMQSIGVGNDEDKDRALFWKHMKEQLEAEEKRLKLAE